MAAQGWAGGGNLCLLPSISTKEIPVRPLSAHIHSVTEETRLEFFVFMAGSAARNDPRNIFLNGDTFGHFQDKNRRSQSRKDLDRFKKSPL